MRATFHDSGDAASLVETLTLAGFEAGVRQERFAGEDDGEATVHVVYTDAPAEEVDELIEGLDAWVEESSPLIEQPAADLPTQPRRLMP